MTHEELFNLLNQLDIPVAYDHFNENVEPPFMAYREVVPNILNADNKSYYKSVNFEIEVVTTKKDLNLQNRIEELLTSNNVPYTVSDEVWDGAEKIYHNYYEI